MQNGPDGTYRSLTGFVLLGLAIFADFASVWLNTHKFGSAAKHSDTLVHLLASSTQSLCSISGQLSKGHHVPLSWCGSWGSSPTRETTTWGCSALLFGSSRSWNHEPLTIRTAAALLVLRRLFLSVGDRRGVDGKSTTLSVDPHGRPLIGRPTNIV